ncbi:MAG: DUF4332 domain-containing protein [Planctomycetota bacterium]
MRVTGLSATAAVARRGWELTNLSPGLSVATGERGDLARAADLLSHTVLGWREDRPAGGDLAGEIAVTTDAGDARLRREIGPGGQPRLTIAATSDGVTATGVAAWRAGAPVEVLAEVFCPRPMNIDSSLRRLLSPRVAAAMRSLVGKPSESRPSADRRRDERLHGARRRDAVAVRIEQLLAERREQGVAIDAELADLAARLGVCRDQLAAADERLQRLDARLQTADSRARYDELARVARESQEHRLADDFAPRRDDLDAQIDRWRQTLAELERREAVVRDQLAQRHPDDRRPELALADQRASVAVAQRLIADLESEVARFAGVTGNPHCVCSDAHPRLNPLVETLNSHVLRLAGHVQQQSDALRWQELSDESERLDRSRSEIRQQLDKLLERRETLVRTSRARVASSEPITQRGDGTFDRAAAEVEHAELTQAVVRLRAELHDHEAREAELTDRRGRLLESPELAELQRELQDSSPRRVFDEPSAEWRGDERSPLRASAVLAKLSDGVLREVRLTGSGRGFEVVNERGERVGAAGLDGQQRQIVAWALRLALADAAIAAGVAVPLVLDEPFGEGPTALSDRHAANLATVLDELRARGAQVFVFTSRSAALNRFASLGARPRTLLASDASMHRDTPVASVVEKTVVTTPVRPPTLLRPSDPVERFPAPVAGGVEAFARSRIRTLRELMLGDPSAIAEELDVDGVTAELVSLWQSHLSFVCFVPTIDFQAAKLLTAAGVLSTAELAESDAEALREQLAAAGGAAEQVAQCEAWVELSNDAMSEWTTDGFAEQWARNHAERRERISQNARRRRRVDTPSAGLRIRRPSDAKRRPRKLRSGGERKQRSEAKSLRFYLNTTDEVEAAPSIGPKRAARLTEVGVVTVQHLLDADPTETAERLDDSRVDASRIVAWQHQASLVCRVPGLRGHDAQVLVGSGFTTPEEIATMKPSELFEFVDAYCDTSDGQRALRGSARPDLEEVGGWIAASRQRRVLGAA